MVTFPNAKINLGLNITRKRSDGYHDLETVFYPINIKDALEVIPSTELQFESTGLTIEGSLEDNLCVKAYSLLKADYPQLPAVQIHLHKNIPMGAGLGGGSSDGAFMLAALTKKLRLNIDDEKLLGYALRIGSDCPFFINNKPSYATGRGEQLEEIELDLSSYKFVVVHPQIHISTKTAFSQLFPSKPAKSIEKIIQQPIDTWRDELKNDFEEPVFSSYPFIVGIKQQLYEAGAVYSSMTGTGSSVYGIFEGDKFSIPVFPQNFTVFTC